LLGAIALEEADKTPQMTIHEYFGPIYLLFLPLTIIYQYQFNVVHDGALVGIMPLFSLGKHFGKNYKSN